MLEEVARTKTCLFANLTPTIFSSLIVTHLEFVELMFEFHSIYRVTWTNCAKSNKISPWELTPRVKKSAITWEISFPFCWIRASPSRTRLGSFSFISSQRTVNLRLDFQRLSFVRLETSRSFSNLVDEVKVKFVEVPESKSVFRVLTIFFSNFGMVFFSRYLLKQKSPNILLSILDPRHFGRKLH